MRTKRTKIDTVMLAVALFCVSGACLAYNLHTAEGGDVSVSLNDLISHGNTVEYSAISDVAVANIEAVMDIPVGAVPDDPVRNYELLPPLLSLPE